MTLKETLHFDPKAFLSKVSAGRNILHYRKDQIIFSQGYPADTVYYLQKDKAKLTVASD